MPIPHMPDTDLHIASLPHPAGSLLAGRTDDFILKAYARHHQAI